MRLFDALRSHRARRRRPRKRSHRHVRRPVFERLQDRQLLAASTYLFIDFDGATDAELSELCDSVACSTDLSGRWGGDFPDPAGFVQTFPALNAEYANFSFLDFDGDGDLDLNDGWLAAEKVRHRVQEDFAPYDVDVIMIRPGTAFPTMSAALDAMRSNPAPAGDALILATGPYFDGTFRWGGQSVTDAGRDVAGNVGAAETIARAVNLAASGGYIQGSDKVDAFLNVHANLISQEAGHSFGLEHINVDPRLVSYPDRATDPRGRTIMTHAAGYRNEGFEDLSFVTDAYTGGTIRPEHWQNTHQYLTETLGPSTRPWAAVLRPGELYVSAGAGSAPGIFQVFDDAAGDWTVLNWSRFRGYRVDPAAQPHPYDYASGSWAGGLFPDLGSMNRWGVPIDTIRFAGGPGNDVFEVDDDITARVFAYGNGGDDWLKAGGGDDFLMGGDGNDTLYGGPGNDTLLGDSGNGRDRGNDRLYGGDGSDVLDGGPGHDRLYGGAGRDYLYGKGGRDRLYGGPGNDRLYGGHGNDELDGGAGVDYLFGQGGDDLLDGGYDGVTDYLHGGLGADTFVRHWTYRRGAWRSYDVIFAYAGDGDRINDRYDGGSWWEPDLADWRLM